MIKRRHLVKTLGLMSLGAWTGALIGPLRARAQSGNPLINTFINPLKIPPLMRGTEGDSGREFDLRMAAGSSRFFADRLTPTLGFNGDYLGPTLHFRQGEKVQLAVHNHIGEPTTVHWHGMRIPPEFDGGPRQVIAPGQTWRPKFTILQDANTCWYHSHMLHKTGEQVYRGLAGMIIVDDDGANKLPLPRTYGIDDIPLILQDRAFQPDGSLRYSTDYDDVIKGMRGDTILINGTRSPYFIPTNTIVRFRILNAANARVFTLAFSDGRGFHQIASDGGLLPKAVAMKQLMLGPAERAEIVVDVSDGLAVNLVSLPKAPDYPIYNGAMSRLMREMDIEHFDLLAIRPAASLTPGLAIPSELRPVNPLQERDAVTTRQFKLMMGFGSRSGEDLGGGQGNRDGSGGGYGGGVFLINGRTMDMNYINERVHFGDTEIWELHNTSPMTHPFHLHGVHFQLLDRNGAAPPANESGWKDTVLVRTEEKIRIIMRFADFADPQNPYMYHCHNLEHEDRGMMGQFLVEPT